jgi:hypothetical protein
MSCVNLLAFLCKTIGWISPLSHVKHHAFPKLVHQYLMLVTIHSLSRNWKLWKDYLES